MTETDQPTSAETPRRTGGRGLSSLLLPELKRIAAELGIKGAGGMRKGQLVEAITAAQGGGASEGAAGGRTRPATTEQSTTEQPKQDQPQQEQPKQEQEIDSWDIYDNEQELLSWGYYYTSVVC